MYVVRVRNLNSKDRLAIYDWLRTSNVDIRRIDRTFSDVYPIAELLQENFPRQIELNNYPKRSRISLKMENWETFNFKVLSKYNMILAKAFIEELARGILRTVEVFLHEMIRLRKQKGNIKRIKVVKKNQEDQFADHQSEKEIEYLDYEESGDSEAPSKMILYSEYEEISRQCQAKDNIIYCCEVRINHLEDMLSVKAECMNQISEIVHSLPKRPKPVTK